VSGFSKRILSACGPHLPKHLETCDFRTLESAGTAHGINSGKSDVVACWSLRLWIPKSYNWLGNHHWRLRTSVPRPSKLALLGSGMIFRVGCLYLLGFKLSGRLQVCSSCSASRLNSVSNSSFLKATHCLAHTTTYLWQLLGPKIKRATTMITAISGRPMPKMFTTPSSCNVKKQR